MSRGICHCDGWFKLTVNEMYKPNDLVTLRDGDGLVGSVIARTDIHAGENWYRVRFGASVQQCRESDLRVHIEGPTLVELLSTDGYGGPDAFRRHATAIKLKLQLTDTLYSYGASRTQLYPYQFIPLLKFLESHYRRILIADEVGLGKTIEAGYILQEEIARGRLARVLVVCPASLRTKWQDELLHRFGRRFEILDAAGARSRIPLNDGEKRTAYPLRAIVSLPSIRNDAFLDSITSKPSPIDLLIVDEAHHLRNSSTAQSKAVSALVEQSDSVVFLSATPIQTSELNLFVLLNILIPEEFGSEEGFRQRIRLNQPIVEAETLLRQQGVNCVQEAAEKLRKLSLDPGAGLVTNNPLFGHLMTALKADLPDSATRRVDLQEQLSQLNLLSNVFTRTKRKDVHLNIAQRRAITPEAKLTLAEQDIYDKLSEYLFRQYSTRHGDGIAAFILTTYQRQIASSIPASIRKFRDAIRDAGGRWDAELDDGTDAEGESEEPAKYRPIDDEEFREIVLGADLEALEEHDTKYDLLLSSLRNQYQLVASGERTLRKALVFSYFRRSLDYLERRFARDGIRYVRIDGSVKSSPQNPETDERQKRITCFRDDPQIDVMLTSEVGSEGLDFQFCDAMVNWDLPWNPMVVEQRIGRLDRIGQKSPQIVIINLACTGTIEARILHRLYDRIGIFERSIGALEPIIGDIVRTLELELFRPGLSEEQQIRILLQQETAIATQRRNLAVLESKTEMLIGHDEYFRTKLDRIRRFGRYVGGDELRLFADNELKSIAPGLVFEAYESCPGLYKLAYRPEVERLVDQTKTLGDDAAQRFVSGYRLGRLTFAFAGEIAERYPQEDVEPLHSQHPLVRALAHRLEEKLIDFPQIASLAVKSAAVQQGLWFYLWAVVVETGFLEAKSIVCALINVGTEMLECSDSDAGDELLADMLRAGCNLKDFKPPSPTDAMACLASAEHQILQRVKELTEKRRTRFEAIKASRRGSVESTFSVRIARQRERLDGMAIRSDSDPKARRILPALQGRLDQLELDRQNRIDAIDLLRLGAVTYTTLGAGFVKVMPLDMASKAGVS